MSLVESNMLPLSTVAPQFSLPNTIDGSDVSFDDIKGQKGTVVMFICNHCPYVIHVNAEIVRIAKEYQAKGIGFVAISSNDVVNYKDDSPDKMRLTATLVGYTFPYLYDESQEVAKAYDAACTPDFYVFNSHDKLVYRGRMDGSRPGNNEVTTGANLRTALDAVTFGIDEISPQIPSAGCNIKWK